MVVLLLLGLVGAIVSSRFASPNAFNALAARDGILATARAAQQMALGRESVSFNIQSSGDNWLITASADAGATLLRSYTVPSKDIVLETGSAVANTDSCADAYNLAITNDFELSFDGRGNLLEFTNNALVESVDASFNGVRLCINDDVSLAICISPAGFAAEGECDA